MGTTTTEGRGPGMNSRAYSTLHDFFQRYLVERDAAATLAMLSEDFYSVGTGEGEIAVGKEAFAELLRTELEQLPNSIAFTMTNYTEKERVHGCWDCLCSVEAQVTLPGEKQVLYRMRVTAGMHWEGERCMIDTVHASEASRYQEEGEFFPVKFISQGLDALGSDTRHELMKLIGQMMPGGIVGGYMEEGFPLYVANERFLSMAGYESYEDFSADIGGLIINSIHPEDRTYVQTEVKMLLTRANQYEIQYRMKKKDGTYLWVHDIGRRTVAADGRDAIISVLIDISYQVDTQTRLEMEAVSDPLTGIYNRKGGQIRIAEAMQHAAEYVFFMLDLDNFKRVNDLYGHEQGDKVLCAVAYQLKKVFRKTDVICRLGGDEFAVFVWDCKDIQVIRDKMQWLIDSYRAMMQGGWPAAKSTMSAGGVYGCKSRTFSELYQLADDVLYEIKNSQKGRVSLHILD